VFPAPWSREITVISVPELLLRCLASTTDHAACQKLWLIVESVCVFPVTRILEVHGLRNHQVWDVMQDLYLQLQKNACGDLKRFRGSSEAELRSFLRRIARRLAHCA
jgi:hypothetical protein